MKNLSLSRFAPVAAALAVASTSASAAIDTSAITEALTDAGIAAAVVGTAYLVVVGGIKALKMIRAAM